MRLGAFDGLWLIYSSAMVFPTSFEAVGGTPFLSHPSKARLFAAPVDQNVGNSPGGRAIAVGKNRSCATSVLSGIVE